MGMAVKSPVHPCCFRCAPQTWIPGCRSRWTLYPGWGTVRAIYSGRLACPQVRHRLSGILRSLTALQLCLWTREGFGLCTATGRTQNRGSICTAELERFHAAQPPSASRLTNAIPQLPPASATLPGAGGGFGQGAVHIMP